MFNSKIVTYSITFVLVAFALLTLFLSSSVLFDWFGIRAKEGNYVEFVVWTNFTAGILYLIAAYGFFQSNKWTFWILTAIAVILFIAFIALLGHIDRGGLFEFKTIRAMVFRIVLTIAFALITYYKLLKQKK